MSVPKRFGRSPRQTGLLFLSILRQQGAIRGFVKHDIPLQFGTMEPMGGKAIAIRRNEVVGQINPNRYALDPPPVD
jgi:hypothetical protein